MDNGASELAASDVLEDAIECAWETLFEHYVESLVLPYSTTAVLAILDNAMEALCVRHDIGESQDWEEATEPEALKIDAWARNVVPVKRKIKPGQEESIAVVSRSLRSHTTKTKKNTQNNTPAIKEKVHLVAPIPGVTDEPDEAEELLRHRTERSAQRKHSETKRIKQLYTEQEKNQRRLGKELEELKKKNYTYDKTGNVVAVQTVNCLKLPPMNTLVNYTVYMESPTKAVKGIRSPRRREVPATEQEFVKNVTTTQPPLFNSIALTPGVTIVQGDNVRHSPAVQRVTMTRAQYTEKKIGVTEVPPEQDTMYPQETLFTSSRKLFETVPDYEFTGERVSEDSEYRVQKHSVNLLQNKVTQFIGDGARNEGGGPINQFNLEIRKNRSWGMNPPMKPAVLPVKLPIRPSEREVRRTHGDLLKKPKDHPFVSSKELWEARGHRLKRPRDRPYIDKSPRKALI